MPKTGKFSMFSSLVRLVGKYMYLLLSLRCALGFWAILFTKMCGLYINKGSPENDGRYARYHEWRLYFATQIYLPDLFRLVLTRTILHRNIRQRESPETGEITREIDLHLLTRSRWMKRGKCWRHWIHPSFELLLNPRQGQNCSVGMGLVCHSFLGFRCIHCRKTHYVLDVSRNRIALWISCTKKHYIIM